MFEKKIAELNKKIDERIIVEANYLKKTYTVEEIQSILGISKTKAYDLCKSGVFHCVRVGRRIIVSKKSFDEWLGEE